MRGRRRRSSWNWSRARICRSDIARGAIPLDEALPIAKQIAEALEAAHEQGIIHRDLKPANIKVRADGTVKVLDFGLAKALDPVGAASASSSAIANSPTITSPAMTQTGIILGTAAYMSPEQASGKPVDKRADIWAFGCVLFEMLTGTRAFGGERCRHAGRDAASEPDWSALPATTPAGLADDCCAAASRKIARGGLADMADARLEIDEALRGAGHRRRCGADGARGAALAACAAVGGQPARSPWDSRRCSCSGRRGGRCHRRRAAAGERRARRRRLAGHRGRRRRRRSAPPRSCRPTGPSSPSLRSRTAAARHASTSGASTS